MENNTPKDERVLLVGVAVTRGAGVRRPPAEEPAEESLDELEVLARSAGADVAGRILQRREALDAATLIGAGKVEEVKRLAGADGIDAVIFDRDLTPTQLRNLERSLDCKVLDRTQLILDIFARRARTREGQLQVELAQLNYLLPRLTGRGTEMSRLGGGIGTRGPGETQLETDRRRIYRRVQKIREQLQTVRRSRSVQRSQRQGIPLPAVALVGYTNAGKSTLFNRLTGAAVYADDRLFATLDPTSRVLELPSRRRAVLSDTVGFIRNLPTTLVEAFRATLDEVGEAVLLLHVVDASSAAADRHGARVFEVLHEIHAASIPQLLVLNKADRIEEHIDAEALLRRMLSDLPAEDRDHPVLQRAVVVSARTGQGIDELLKMMDEAIPVDPIVGVLFRFPAGAGQPLHLVHEYGKVLRRSYDGDDCVVEAAVPESLRRRLEEYVAR